MFSQDFYPTPPEVIDQMLAGVDIENRVILEPSAGKGNIVEFLQDNGAKEVIACEINDDLASILATKCKVIEKDFLSVRSEHISHVNAIIMNPPFSADESHILHAWEIAPDGCRIVALCNLNTIKNTYTKDRQKLSSLVDQYGSKKDLGDCFLNAERRTGVNVGLISLQKPGNDYGQEFEGFFLDEEPEQDQFEGVMRYDAIRDLVNRYVAAVKIFDEQLETAVRMNRLTSSFYSSALSMSIHEDNKPKRRNDFKKDLQKSAWMYIFKKMNMEKLATKGLKEDINKFVESQTQIPFTMKNIYRMLDIVIGTTEQRMDKALVEVFDTLTKHYHENRYNVEGWKTNSHYLMNEKFIIPGLVAGEEYGTKYNYVNPTYSSNFERVEDLNKALCYITGSNYDSIGYLRDFYRNDWFIKDSNGEVLSKSYSEWEIKRVEEGMKKAGQLPHSYSIGHIPYQWGQWYEWGFFEVRAYKKGTIHFKFKDRDVWAKFNQRIAKIKGFPLWEHKEEKVENLEFEFNV